MNIKTYNKFIDANNVIKQGFPVFVYVEETNNRVYVNMRDVFNVGHTICTRTFKNPTTSKYHTFSIVLLPSDDYGVVEYEHDVLSSNFNPLIDRLFANLDKAILYVNQISREYALDTQSAGWKEIIN